MMESWTTEWVFIIVAVLTVIAFYVKRDKVKNLFGGGKPGNGVNPRRK